MVDTLCGAVRNCNLERVRTLMTQSDTDTLLAEKDIHGLTAHDICQQAISSNRYYLEMRHPDAPYYLERYSRIMDLLEQ